VLDVMVGMLSQSRFIRPIRDRPGKSPLPCGIEIRRHHHNAVIVVEEDVDIHNTDALMAAMHDKTDFVRGLVVFPEYIGSPIDVMAPYELRNELAYGASIQNKLLIDATTDWEVHPSGRNGAIEGTHPNAIIPCPKPKNWSKRDGKNTACNLKIIKPADFHGHAGLPEEENHGI